MPATDLPLLIEAVIEAGEVARRFAGPEVRVWDKADNAGPVTEADLAVNETLQSRLRGQRPDYGWLSEETEDNTDRLSCEQVFIVDPIDGTRSFIEGGRTWAHVAAVAQQGQVTAAAIYLPLRDKLYSAALGQGAELNGRPIMASDRAHLAGAALLASRNNLEPKHWRADVPDVALAFRPSLAYRQSLVAEGRFDAMLTLRKTWEWDIAAGDLILREAGAVVSDRAGQPLRFNNPHPQVNGVVAANAELHDTITDALAD
ncbi:MAG: 3'(2'),5'-bisphosphate nucleotidase CysQ [Pseudomonadota bacterium]